MNGVTMKARGTSAASSWSESREWWQDAVVYQIYPRSFADADGDGLGDLPGVISRLDYLAELGIDAIWMSPFYPSPLRDGGYDVSDYRDVDPRLGTLDDFGALVAACHHRGIRVIIDIVPNHTSSDHPWFRAALAAEPGSAERARYVFREGQGEAPPSDWQSHFGGSAWERTPDGQWYLHLFDRDQPDLNWSNPEVRDFFLGVLRFWGDLGVDGFRVDVAHALVKDLAEPLRSQPHLDRLLPPDGSDPLYDRDELHEIYRSWRAVFDEYDPPLMGVAETWSPANPRTALYARRDELGQAFDFSLLKAQWGVETYAATIEDALDRHRVLNGGSGSSTWVLSSHDVPRHASRLALPSEAATEQWLLSNGREPAVDSDRGLRRAHAATVMMLALPGSAYLYQGEELGLPEVASLTETQLHDPVWQRSGGTVKGRDGCRVPLPWTAGGSSYGFGAHGSWIAQPPRWGELSVQAQEADQGSTLHLYRRALALRRVWVAPQGEFAWVDGPDGTLAFSRGDGFVCIVNFSEAATTLPPASRVLISTQPIQDGLLPAESAAWLAVH